MWPLVRGRPASWVPQPILASHRCQLTNRDSGHLVLAYIATIDVQRCYSTCWRYCITDWSVCICRGQIAGEKDELRGIEQLNLCIFFSPLSVVLDLANEVVIRMHFLIRRKCQKRIICIGLPPTLSFEGRGSPFEERRKPSVSSMPSMAIAPATFSRHLKDKVQESVLDRGCTKSQCPHTMWWVHVRCV